ncbi:hypothetical protein H4S07_000296 [Coemansia furcata]|uniref:Uncharacterized protein n=1 Tax=Coemansia furcata TaxID=417177 RepID=A0ACC1LRH6_9FUNG|nr:hypothetical protein H4S07_000296 [Coemansia furcata]
MILDIYTRYQDDGWAVPDLLADKGVIILVDMPSNYLSLEQLIATPFVLIVFQALDNKPAYYIGFHDYGIDGFPVPVIPEH